MEEGGLEIMRLHRFAVVLLFLLVPLGTGFPMTTTSEMVDEEPCGILPERGTGAAPELEETIEWPCHWPPLGFNAVRSSGGLVTDEFRGPCREHPRGHCPDLCPNRPWWRCPNHTVPPGGGIVPLEGGPRGPAGPGNSARGLQ